MPIICPSVMAPNADEYKIQIEKVAGFAQRVQIDLTDGKFAAHQTIKPDEVWWPVGLTADIHLMFADPLPAAEQLLKHSPSLIIVHAEAEFDFEKLAGLCEEAGVGLGVALLPHTSVEIAALRLAKVRHALIFSGNLGEFGGHANLALLEKAKQLKERYPQIEIGWDGGVNDQNVAALADGGVDVLDVGGFIQNSPEPERSFKALQRIADETGTT